MNGHGPMTETIVQLLHCFLLFFFFLIFAEREHLNRNVIYFLNKRTRATGRSTRTDYISAINRAVVRPPVLCGVYLLVFHFIPNHDHDCCKNAPSLYPFFLLNHLKKIWSMCCVLVWSDVRITNRARARAHTSHRIASHRCFLIISFAQMKR